MTGRDRFAVVVHVVVERHGRVLLLRRARTGFMDGWFVPPGGHLQHGESLHEAGVRECREEAGVTVEELAPLCLLPYRSGAHQGINMVFRATDWRGEPRLAEPELFDELLWALPRAWPEPSAPWLPVLFDQVDAGRWFHELRWD